MDVIIKRKLAQRFINGAQHLLDQLLPPRCLSCGTGVQDTGRVCSDCWKKLEFLQGPACDCCGHPFDFQGGASLCGDCLIKRPAFDRVRSVLRYDDGSRRMIIGYKHHDRTDYADFFGQLLFHAGQYKDLTDAVVAPVPLHKKRLGKRRYNQSALLGHIFAQKKSWQYIPDLLCREKHTPPQNGNYGHRKRNVAGAFKFSEKYRDNIRGRPVILIDDVYTTGATVGACAQILKRAGAEKVEILTIARVCHSS